MGIGRLAGGVLVLVAMLSGTKPVTGAEPTRLEREGFRMDVPAGWRPMETGPATAMAGDAATRAALKGLVGAWIVFSPGAVLGSATVLEAPTYLEVSREASAEARRELDRALRSLPIGGDFRLKDLRVVDLNGEPAYRIRGGGVVSGVRIEALIYVVAGRKTYFLTFVASPGAFPSLESEFERAASTARVEGRARLLRRMPPWLCGSALGILGGIAIAARRARKARGGL